MYRTLYMYMYIVLQNKCGSDPIKYMFTSSILMFYLTHLSPVYIPVYCRHTYRKCIRGSFRKIPRVGQNQIGRHWGVLPHVHCIFHTCTCTVVRMPCTFVLAKLNLASFPGCPPQLFSALLKKMVQTVLHYKQKKIGV